MPFPTNCNGHLASLGKSPTFAMSLGAKELFHTNFLAFLLESQDPCIQPIQCKLKKLLFGHNKVGRVITWREKNSLDLVIMPAPKKMGNPKECGEESDSIGGGGKVGEAELDYNCSCEVCKNNAAGKTFKYCDTIAVVIEAKLKSVPTEEQLNKYDEVLININNKGKANGVDFELDEVDWVNVYVKNKKPIQVRTWQVMKLALCNSGVMNECKSDCTIYARGQMFSGGGGAGRCGEIRKFDGGVRRLLLLPLSPSPGDRLGCWEKMSWQRVVDALKCCREQGNSCEPLPRTIGIPNCKATDLLSRIICDYRDSLEQLLAILDKVDGHVKSSVITASAYSYNNYYKAITAQQFKAHRIHDLVGKYASHVLERHVMDFICPALGSAAGSGESCTEGCSGRHALAEHSTPLPIIRVCGHDFQLNSYTHFSNQQPGVGFEWLATEKVGAGKGERKLSFGVQIQGNDYRHFICVGGGQAGPAKKVLDELEMILGIGPNGWFMNGVAVFVGAKSPPQFGVKKNNAGFFVFGKDVFRYSKADIGGFPMPDLAQSVCHSLCSSRNIVGHAGGSALCKAIKDFFA